MRQNLKKASRPLALAAIVLSACGQAQAAGTWDGLADGPTCAESCVTSREAMTLAVEFAAAGRLVEAREILRDLATTDRWGKLTSDEHERVILQLGSVNRRLDQAHPVAVSLSKAELSLARGELGASELQAKACLSHEKATPAHREQAEAILSTIETRRSELLPRVPGLIEQARGDFEAGRYAEAKSSLGILSRSGVELTPSQRASVESYSSRLVDLERAQGVTFRTIATAGVLQPGAVRRQDNQPAGDPPPAVELPGDQPGQQPDLIEQARRVQAQAMLSDANRAFDEKRMNEALNLYHQLSTTYRGYLTAPQLDQVASRMAEARAMVGGPGGEVNLIDKIIEINTLKRQAAQAEFNTELELASTALRTGDPDRANEHVAKARLNLSSAREVFSETELQTLTRRADDLSAQISRRRLEILTEQANQQQTMQKRLAEDAEKMRQSEREARINELLDRARAYQREMRYTEALQAIDQLLFYDPISPAGLLLRDVLTDTKLYYEYNLIQQRKNTAYSLSSLENQEASVPAYGIVQYPPDWPTISFKRGEPIHFAESPENRRVLGELDNKRLQSVAFDGNPFSDVVAFIAQVSQLNIDVDWDALDRIGVSREDPISLSLTNVPLRVVLDRVMEKATDDPLNKADWAVSDGVIMIASDEALRRNTVLVIYDIRDLLIDIPDYDQVPQIDLQSVLQSGQGGGSGQSPFRDNQQDLNDQDRRSLQERTDEIIDIIIEQIDPDGWRDRGGETGFIQRLGGNLIIRNTAKNHREIAGLLSKLRQIRNMQINVETRFLLVNQDFFERIGIDVDVYLNSNNNQVRFARDVNGGGVPTVQPSDFFDGGRPRRSITSPQLGPVQGQELQGVSQSVVNPQSWSPIGIQQGHFDLSGTIAPSSDWAGLILGAAPAMGIGGQFLDDIQVDFLLQATQADRRSVSLQAPRLTFTNGQTANIYVASQTAFVSDLTPVVGDSAVGFDPDVDVVTEGVTLLVEGTVSADRRYVTLNIDAAVSRLDGFGREPVVAIAGGQLVNSAAVQSFIQTPQVTVSRVQTTVTAPDQGTILLGGQRLITEFEVETGVPVLSKMPIINRFFTNRIESKEEQTLLILVKPTVLIQNEEEERAFPGLAESLRAGLGG